MPRKTTRHNGAKRLARRKSHVPGTKRKVFEGKKTMWGNYIEVVHAGNSVGIVAYDRERADPTYGIILASYGYKTWDGARKAFDSIRSYSKALAWAAKKS
jgi:hypothetical protein